MIGGRLPALARGTATRAAIALGAVAILAAGCSGGGGTTAASSTVPGTAPAPTTPTTLGPGGPNAIVWTDPDHVVTFPNGWTLQHCEGEAPLWCVDDGTTTVEAVELLRHPLEGIDILRQNPTIGGLAEWAGAVVGDLMADRENCGEGYQFEAKPVAVVPVTGQEGIRYGWVATLAEGTPSEATVAYATIHGGFLTILLADAYEPAGCLPPEGPELTVAQLTTLEPFLDLVAAESGTPPPLR